jgi:hypothetical protein
MAHYATVPPCLLCVITRLASIDGDMAIWEDVRCRRGGVERGCERPIATWLNDRIVSCPAFECWRGDLICGGGNFVVALQDTKAQGVASDG